MNVDPLGHYPPEYVAEIRAERGMLLRRLVADHEHDSTLVGRSSTAMLIAAFYAARPSFRPYDVYDLNRCERTYEAAPEHLRERMLPMLMEFRRIVEAEAAERGGWLRDSLEREHRPADTPAPERNRRYEEPA